MFSIPLSWPSPGALGRVFSLDCWLAHLKSWHHPFPSKKAPSQGLANNTSSISFVQFSTVSEQLTLALPSPTIHWSFDHYLEGPELDSDSDTSTAPSSRCQTPSVEHDNRQNLHISSISTFPMNPLYHSAAAASHQSSNRQALLGQYSDQELVLLEFLTHSSDVKNSNIDDVLNMYPPGFSKECCCDPEDYGRDLCEVCQLAEAYLDHSFERYQATAGSL